MNVFGDAVFVVFICWDLLRFFVYNMKIFPVQYFGDTNIHWDIDTSAQQNRRHIYGMRYISIVVVWFYSRIAESFVVCLNDSTDHLPTLLKWDTDSTFI